MTAVAETSGKGLGRVLFWVLLFFLTFASGCGGKVIPGEGLKGNLRIAGSTSMEELTSALAERFMELYPGVTVTVEFVGSSAGAEAVMGGTADIANMSRAVSPEEKAGGMVENVAAVDGIVVCVDGDNPVKGLTREQLRGIYTGEIRNWSDVGGRHLPVVTVGREAGSGTRDTFEEKLGLEERCEYANVMDSAGAVMARVAHTPGAIGYLSLDAVNDEICVLELDGTKPSGESIGQGEYGLCRYYIMGTKGDISVQPPLVQAWFAFVYGGEGRRIIEKAGLVPVE